MAHQGRLVGGVLAVLAVVAVGCDQRPDVRQYEDFAGVVTAVDPNRAELFIQHEERPGRPRRWVRPVVYKLTAESEIYINDMVRTLAEVQPGDRAEVLGLRDFPEEPAWVLVSVAYLKRDMPPPSPPKLEPATAARDAE